MTVWDKAAAFSRAYELLPSEGTVLAAVSGGADSMCLLDVLLTLGERMGFSVAVAHMNHQLRGADSDGDAVFVEDCCRARGVPFFGGAADVAGARRGGESLEAAARRLRYDFLRRAMQEAGASVCATAHTADDNAETVLLNLSRGTGLRGLCGIPPRRDGFVRPLLSVTRAEIEAYNRVRGVPHREDASNAGDDYARNRLRHQALPVFRALRPDFADAVGRMTELLREDETYLTGLAEGFLEEHGRERLPVPALLALPGPVASRVLRLVCPQSLSREHVRAAMSLCAAPSPSGSLDLPGITLRREYDALVVGGSPPGTGFASVRLTGSSGRAALTGTDYTVCWETEPRPREVYKSFTTFFFKIAAICGSITVRPRLEGDRLRLGRSQCEKTVKKLLMERRIPAAARGSVPVISDEAGPMAVYGVGQAGRTWPEPEEPTLRITIEERMKP